MQLFFNQRSEHRTHRASPEARQSQLQTSCQKQRGVRKGFTLIELLVVITIIGILASALVVNVQAGFKRARQADCKSKLRQIGIAITIYRGEHDNRVPDWISNLFPEYVDDQSQYVCLADRKKGSSYPRPLELIDHPRFRCRNDVDTVRFWDNDQNRDIGRNLAVKNCSYLYEFSGATTSWRVPNDARGGVLNPANPYTMGAYKMDQMHYGDENNRDKTSGIYLPYGASRIPIVRCFHHWNDQRVPGRFQRISDPITKLPIALNVAYAGNIFVSPPWWEGTVRPEEQQAVSP